MQSTATPWARGGQKAEFVLCRGGLHIFLRMRSSKNVFVGGGGAKEELVLFLIFFANLKSMIASIFLAKFHGGFAFLTQHSLSFSMVKSLILHLVLLSLCKV